MLRVVRNWHWAIPGILLIAIMLRAIAFTPYGIYHPDEAFQYLEQAHRLAFGPGLVPWEYRLGMRSWLVPLMLAGPMWLGEAIAPGSILYIVLPRVTVAIIALAPIGAAHALGARISRAHALVAMAVVTVWYESVLFSVHVLTEVLSVACFLPAAALLARDASRRRLIAAGALLGLSVIFRFHYAPAAAVLAAISLRADRRAWGWLIVGGAAAFALSGAIDIIMGQWPFAWVTENFRQNIVQDRASAFGTFEPIAYVQMMWLQWGPATLPILLLAALVARRYPALFAAAVLNIVVHMAIGHKEYRFIWLSTQILVLLAAIGSVDLAERWFGRRSRPVVLTSSVIVAWALTSAMLAFTGSSRPDWRRFSGGFELARMVDAGGACGLGLLNAEYWSTGGQAFLHRPIPLYYTTNESVRLSSSAFDAIVSPPGDPDLPPAYRTITCRGSGADRLCLARRPGRCTHTPASDHVLMQQAMEGAKL